MAISKSQARYLKTEKGKAKNKEHQARYRARHRERITAHAKSPLGKYEVQKGHAKARGVEWEFTFETWWQMWEPHWDKRGTTITSMQMCRGGDCGPYSPENCRIDTHENNLKEQHGKLEDE